ncbi:unnamed protein product [Paramecium octaurelia]|uniref:Transmembrane protein n=1 Tax=Paramecium octaurelia TaxID=43137 RepID=A0A8S1WC65_PAROT|nr:unnamed protein product [Paramecium octaurelia]
MTFLIYFGIFQSGMKMQYLLLQLLICSISAVYENEQIEHSNFWIQNQSQINSFKQGMQVVEFISTPLSYKGISIFNKLNNIYILNKIKFYL